MEKLLKRSRVAMKKSDKAGPGFSKEKSPESSGGFPGTLQAMTILRSESSGFSIKEVARVERRRHAFRPADVALEAAVERPAAVFGGIDLDADFADSGAALKGYVNLEVEIW